MHGEEEARLVLVDSFHNENERGEMRNLRGEGEVEDPLPWMFQQHNPEFNPPFSQFNRVSFCRMLTVPCWIRKGWWIPPWRGGDTAHDPSDPKTEQAAAAAAAAASGNSKLRDCSFICQSCTWNR